MRDCRSHRATQSTAGPGTSDKWRGVSWRGRASWGKFRYLYANILGTKLFHPFLPTSQTDRAATSNFQLFLLIFQSGVPPVICLLSGFPFQFYRRKEELLDCSLLWWRPDSCFLIFPLSSLSPGNNWSLSFSSLPGPVLSVFCWDWRRKFEEISF